MGNLFSSMYLIKITTADPMYLLSYLTEHGIVVHDVRQPDEMTIQLRVSGKYAKRLQRIANHLGCECLVCNITGVRKWIECARSRAFIICGIAILVFLTIWIPTRVLFISVEGNTYLQESYIIDQAEDAGLFFGVARRSIRNEKIKNALLQGVPDLKWVGINTYGCCAVISVIERPNDDGMPLSTTAVQGIYAVRDGVISSITATKGSLLCKTGQAVKSGQLLISGYTDCGLHIRAEQADGEVRAVTHRTVDAIVPVSQLRREGASQSQKRWRLQFGKKQIKLYIDSGNSDTKCGRIIKEYKLTLPGGFSLPFSVMEETTITYDTCCYNWDISEERIKRLASSFVIDSMVAGTILNDRVTVDAADDHYSVSGIYVCEEMIGKLFNEEIEGFDD